MTDKYFVWIEGTRPFPQIWYGEPVDGNGKPVKSVLFKIKLEDSSLTLDQCIALYPFRGSPDGSDHT